MLLNETNIFKHIVNLCLEANISLPKNKLKKLKQAQKSESNFLGKEVLDYIIKNQNLAKKYQLAMCQDTGSCIFFIKMYQNLYLNFELEKVIQKAVNYAYDKYNFRNSSVECALNRNPSIKNHLIIIHWEITMKPILEISLVVKGAGAENMSALKMLNVNEGINGIKQFIIETVNNAKGKACPPISIGVGVGGNFEQCALLAKKALLDNGKTKNIKTYNLENEIFEKINKLNIGPMGFGGKNTCIHLKILTAPCHIASLPVAVNLNCHAARYKGILLNLDHDKKTNKFTIKSTRNK